MKKLKIYLFSLFLILPFIIISSCEIGLGESVDTEVPQLEINTPEVGVVIRDVFSLRGTWDDDGSIKEIYLSLRTVENDTVGQEVLTKKGVFKKADKNESEKKNTWYCTVNPSEDGIKDGTYEATVTITDEADHSTKAIRQITIDNTAPVVVLQRPGTEKDAAVKDSYGQSFTIEGQAADDSNISHIDVKIYSGETLLDTVRLNNVPPTISLDVAKFLDEHYTRIYGSTEKEGTKSFWCEIEAYDGAQRYPADGTNQSAADTEGNCEKEYYLYEEIKTSVLSTYKITDLYKMKSRTYSAGGERSAEDIQSQVAEQLKDKGKKSGSFTLNPDNSPTYRIVSGGLEGLTGAAADFGDDKNTISNGGEIAIEVNPGLDNIPIDSTVRLRLYAQECDENGNVAEGAAKLYPKSGEPVKSGTKYTMTPVFSQAQDTSDGTGGFVFDAKYRLFMEGRDESGNSIEAKDGKYGFKFTTSGARPAVEVIEPDENEHYIAKDASQRLRGKVTVEAGLADLEVSVYKAGDEANKVVLATDSRTAANHSLYQSTTENGENNFEYEIDCSQAPFNQTSSGNYIIKVKASQGKSTEVTRSISYDVQAPRLKRISAEPLVDKSTDASSGIVSGKVNGSVNLSGEFSDDKSGFKSVSVKVYSKNTSNEWVEQIPSPVTGTRGEEFNINIDTTALPDGRDMKVEFHVEDNAGNQADISREYSVDQSTDRPKAEGNSKLDLGLGYAGSESLRSELNKSAAVRKNIFTSGGQLIISLSDDDGIGSTGGDVHIKLTKNSEETDGTDTFTAGTAATDITEADIEVSGEPVNTSVSYQLPQGEGSSGSYKVELSVRDKIGSLTTSTVTKTFYIQVTGNAPDAVISGSPSYITTNAEGALDGVLKKTAFNVTVNVTDGTPQFNVYRVTGTDAEGNDVYAQNDSGENVVVKRTDLDSTGKTFTETGFKPAGSANVTSSASAVYKVVDKFNSAKLLNYTYKIDNAKPGVSFTNTAPGTNDTENASFRFEGEAEDDTGGSGVSKVEISFDNGISWTEVSGQNSWNYNAVFAGIWTEEGAKTVKVRSVDGVGNRSNEAEQSFIYDKAKPGIAELKFRRSGESTATEAGNGFDSGVEFDLEGRATDTYGVYKVEIYEKYEGGAYPAAPAVTLTAPASVTNYTWNTYSNTQKFPRERNADGSLKSGTYTYKVVAYDVSGTTDAQRKTETKEFSVGIDLLGPEVRISGPESNGEILSGATYAFSGRVNDRGGSAATGVAKVEYIITGAEQSTEPVSGWTEISKTTDGEVEAGWSTTSYTLNEGHTQGGAAEGSLDEGSYKIWVKAYDKAGNATESSAVKTFHADKAAPETAWAEGVPAGGYLNRASLSTNQNADGSKSLILNGSATDTNGIQSVKYTKTAGSTQGSAQTLAQAADGSWELGFRYGDENPQLADGSYTFKVEAEDKAGRKSSVERTWIIDTVNPVITAGSVKAGGTALTDGRWFKSTTISVELGAADNAQPAELIAGSAASGMSMVEWSSDGQSWNAFSLKDGLYKGPVEFSSEGSAAKTLKIRASDNAGNISYWPDEDGITVNIDETPVNLTRESYEINGTEFTDSTVYINGEHALSVYGTYKDEQSGVGELSLTYADGTEINAEISYAAEPETEGDPADYKEYNEFTDFNAKKGIRYWKAEIPVTELTQAKIGSRNTLNVKGVNGAGNEKSVEAYTLVWDNTAPGINGITLKWSATADGQAETEVYKKAETAGFMYYMNPAGKYLTVSGSAGDTNGLSKVEISADSIAEADLPGLSEGSTKESWSFGGMALSGTDGAVLHVTVSATDKAGNTKNESVQITVDKSAPLALHLLDNSGKDLYFRVGSTDNDENKGITSENAAFSDDDRDVGGKYTGGTFGNASTIVIRGSFIDVKDGEKANVEDETATQGSGVKSIYYKVYGAGDTIPEGQNLINEVKGLGQYVTLKGETKRVFFTGNKTEGEYTLTKNNVEDRRAAGSSIAEPYVTKTAPSTQYLAVQANGKESKKHWVNITTTYKDSIAGFSEGTNYLVLVAEDNAGNCAVDTIRNVPETTGNTTSYATYKNYRINVDTEVPSVTSGTTDTVYTNCVGELEINLTATDVAKAADIEPAGIRSVVIEVGSHKIEEEDAVTTYGKVEYVKKTTTPTGTEETEIVTIKPDDATDTYAGKTRKTAYRKVTLKPAAFEGLSGNITVYATVSDAAGAGNSQRVSVATVNVDESAPSVTLEEPKDADSDTEGIQVNKIIELKGNASDAASGTYRLLGLCYTADEDSHAKPAMEKKSISYTWAAPEGWTAIAADQKSGSTAASWTFENINTAQLDGTTATSGKVWVSAAVQDKAGNVGYSEPVELDINQDTDRPKITLTGIDNISSMSAAESGRVWLMYTNILNGKVEDDDGIKDTVSANTVTGKEFWYSTGTDEEGNDEWTQITIGNGGSWKITLADGSYSVKFKVTDVKGSVFETGSEQLPKLLDNAGHVKDIALNLGVDKTSPVYENLKYSYYDSAAAVPGYTGWVTDVPVTGGDRTKFRLQLRAGDENKIASVKVIIGEDEYTGTAVTDENSVPGSGDGGKYYRIWEISNIDVSKTKLGATDQNLTVNLKIKDKAGLEKEDTLRVRADNKAPEIGFTGPSSSTTSCGEIVVYGNANGEPVSMEYAVSADGTHTPDAEGNVTVWSGDGITDEPVISGGNAKTEYKNVNGFGASWQVTFDGRPNTTTASHEKMFTDLLTDFKITTEEALTATENAFEDIVYLYVWIKSRDEVGNESENCHQIKLDPQGDRPSADFSYPDTDGVKMGGKVKIYGTAMDTLGTNVGVDSVWLQIKAGSSSIGTITKEDLDFMADNGYDVYNMKTYILPANLTNGQVNKKWRTTAGTNFITDKEAGYDYSDYAALASSTGAAWNIEINRTLDSSTHKRELDPAGSASTKTSALRIYARDRDGKFSVSADRNVIFDADKPVISGLSLVQRNSSGDVTASRAYSSDMYIKGVWNLEGTVTDKDNIGSLTITINDTEHKLIENGSVTDADHATRTEGTETTDGSATFSYPLASGSGVGKLTISVTAVDKVTEGTPNTQNENLVIFYDNTPADVQKVLTAGKSETATTITVSQSNSWYTFASEASEPAVGEVAQSGYAYTVFYFKRSYTIGESTTTKLYDVLKARGNNDGAATDISTTAALTAAGLTYSNPASGGDGLYWYTKTAGRTEAALNVLTITDAETTIRKNSLVKIGGAFYRVTAVNGTSVTIDGYPAAEFEEVKVAFGAVVDNTVPEGDGTTFGSDGYYESPSRDDGDRMIESVIKSGSTWTWEANICSKNIPDGPVELVYTVFDAAGNTTVKNISGTVDNNSPRLAGVTIKTDYDGNDQFTGSGEVISTWASPSELDDDEYYTGTKTVSGNTVRVYDPVKNSVKLNRKNVLGNAISQGGTASPVAVLKGRTQIIPEVVGGNGAIYYSYDIGGSMSGMNSTTALITDGSIDYTSKEGTIDIQVGDLLTAGDTSSAGTARKFSFMLYDSTEGSYWTEGNASRANAKTASIDLWFAVRVADASDPVVTINPFYWNGLNDNSVYDSENAEKYAQLKGHIELTQDLSDSTFTQSSGLMDTDPKVSGKIVMKGRVTDAKRLKEIKASIFGTYSDATAVTLAQAGSNGLLAETAAASDFDTNGYSFVIDTQTLGSAGHSLTWTLNLDTEMVGQLGLDKAVTIKAFNYGTPVAPSGSVYTSINGTTTYGATTWNNKFNVQDLQMDIVPYVTEVTTLLSVHDTNNPSVYARTALGHYPVYATHAQGSGGYTYEPDIKLKGFNLSGCTVEFEDGITSETLQEKNSSGTAVNYSKEAGLTAGDGVYTFTLPNGAKTGKVSVYKTVGGIKIKSLNNLNSNDAHGVDPAVAGSGYTYIGTIPPQGNQAKYNNFYNRIPNGINNNILTDDLFFDVWEFNSEAARAYADGKADNAVMKINPVSGMIGFAFSNGAERFSMGGTLTAEANVDTNNEYSYRQWNMTFDYMNYNYFAYDSSGHSYGTTSGGDISADDQPRWDFFSFMSDRWGRVGEASGANKNNQGGSYNPGKGWDAQLHNKLIRPEGIGQNGNALTTSTTRSRTNSRIRKDRIQSTSIATLRHGNNGTDNATYIYLAYYDLINKEIRFRAGNILDSDTSVPDKDTQLNRYGSLIDVCTKANNGFTSYAQTADTCQIIATNTTGSISSGKYDQSKTFGSAGNAVALGVTSSNVVVMVWNDGNNNLKIAYNKAPQTLHLGATKDGWTGYTTLISGAGEYCQLVVDGNDNIHVVAYNNSGLDLKYAFVPKTVEEEKNVPNISAAKICDVDTYDNVGSRLSLDVAKEGDNYIPHIGYWGAYPAAPRYAYLADPETFYGTNGNTDEAVKARSGAVSDMYTGVWECGIIPTGMDVKQGKVNVGVWKYDVTEDGVTIKGKKVASNYEEFTVSKNMKSTDSSAENDKGFCYGNTTDNAVLAYVVMPTSTTYHIETAQMR